MWWEYFLQWINIFINIFIDVVASLLDCKFWKRNKTESFSLRIYSLEDKNDALWIRIVYYSLLLLLQVKETQLELT